MKRLLVLLTTFTAALCAQTSVYLRGSGDPAAMVIVSPGCVNGTNGCTVASTAGYSAAMVVQAAGICSLNSNHNISSMNGTRKIASISGNVVYLTDLANNPVNANGVWCNGSTSSVWGGVQIIGKVSSFNLAVGPKGGFFDGTNGTFMREWALGTGNGLANTGSCPGDGLCVSGNVGTVTTTYAHTASVGDHVTVWKSGNSSLDHLATSGGGTDYVVTGTTTYTYTFTTSGVSNGDYTAANMHCGPGASPNGTRQGTLGCLRISQRATNYRTDTSGGWTLANSGLQSMLGQNATFNTSLSQYGMWVDGGIWHGLQNGVAWVWASMALEFLVDQTNDADLAVLTYAINHIEHISGNNWVCNELGSECADYDLDDYQNDPDGMYLATVHAIGAPYQTAAQNSAYVNKILNDVSDASPASTAHAAIMPIAVTSGVTGSTQNDSTHVTLASSDSSASCSSPSAGTYCNNIVTLTHNGGQLNAGNGGYFSHGLVASYNSSTKVATVASWDVAPPTSGETYEVDETITLSGTTVTGYNTTFTQSASPGYAPVGAVLIVPGSGIVNDAVSLCDMGMLVTSAGSDTSATVTLGPIPGGSSTPQILYISMPWQTGDAGLKWKLNHYAGAFGVQPIQYTLSGGYDTAIDPSGTGGVSTPQVGANAWHIMIPSWSALAMDAADYDARGSSWATVINLYGMNYTIPFDMHYMAGPTQSGGQYGITVTGPGAGLSAWMYTKSVTGYSVLDTAGPWLQNLTLWHMYALHPDNPYNVADGQHEGFATDYGGNNVGFEFPGLGPTGSLEQAGFMYLNPTASVSKYWANWLVTQGLTSMNPVMSSVVRFDPRQVASTSYKSQPAQYLFQATSQPAETTNFGSVWPSQWRTDSFISRTAGWNSASDTHLFLYYGTYVNDHGTVQPAMSQLYKTGFLLASDLMPPGAEYGPPTQYPQDSLLHVSDAYTFAPFYFESGTSSYANYSDIANWSSANSGSWPTAYGDQNSRYACAMGDLSKAYTVTLNYAQEWTCHFKKSGLEEIVVQYVDVAAPAATSFFKTIHYPQNGEAVDGANGFNIYPEGYTTCPGAGGCAALNTTRKVLEQEDGQSSHGDPTRQYNLISTWLTPSGSNIFVQFDTPPITISSVTDGNPTVFHATAHGLFVGQAVVFTGLTGSWTGIYALGSTTPITIIDANTFSVAINSTGWGTFSGTVAAAYLGPTPGAINIPAIYITTVTKGSTTKFYCPNGHGLVSGQAVHITGATGNWAATNAYATAATVVDGYNFTIAVNSTAFSGNFNGTVYGLTNVGNGHTARVSICADANFTGMCGSSGQTSLEYIVAHKVATQPDTAFSPTLLSPDANWTGFQNNDTADTGGHVVLFARNGATYSSITSFTTTHSGTAQYLFAGMMPGTYNVTVGGSAVSGSPFTVTAGDNTLYFESAAGAVAITAGAQACSISTTAVPAGVVGTPYSTTLQTANCTAPVTWRVTAGTLCNGLSLDGGSGKLFGTPSSVQNCNFTVQASDSGGNAPMQLLTQSISGSSALSSISVMSSGAATTAGTIRH